jgi:hypothetical protein
MPSFNHYHSHHYIWCKAQTASVYTKVNAAKKVGSPTADIWLAARQKLVAQFLEVIPNLSFD